MTPLTVHDILWIDPDRVSGEPCFEGTRVPVRTFFAWLATGETIDAYLESFPGVRREQLVSLLKRGTDAVIDIAAADLDPSVREELEGRWRRSRPTWEAWELIEKQLRDAVESTSAEVAEMERSRAGAA